MSRLWVCRRFAAVAIIFLSTAAVGAEYRDDRAEFSFVYPDDWIALNDAALQQDRRSLPKEILQWINVNGFNLKKISVIVIHNAEESSPASLNVVISPEEMPIKKDSVRHLKESLQQRIRSPGWINSKPTKIDVQRTTIGANEVIVVEYDGQPNSIKHRQVFIPDGGKTFIVTCSAPRGQFDEYAPTFDAMLTSFEGPPSTFLGFDWMHVLITGAVGGAVGGLVGLLKMLTTKKKARSAAAYS